MKDDKDRAEEILQVFRMFELEMQEQRDYFLNLAKLGQLGQSQEDKFYLIEESTNNSAVPFDIA